MTASDYALYKDRLRTVRRKLNLRQEDVADALGIPSRKSICRKESAQQKGDLTVDMLRYYVEQGVDANWILTGVGPDTVKDCEDCKRAIHRQEAEKKYPWVSPADRLPPVGRMVLVAGRDLTGRNLRAIGWIAKDGTWATQIALTLIVELWMPIPTTAKPGVTG